MMTYSKTPAAALAGFMIFEAIVPAHDKGYAPVSQQIEIYAASRLRLWDNGPESSGEQPLPYVVVAGTSSTSLSATTSHAQVSDLLRRLVG